jgi:hypothetical protein
MPMTSAESPSNKRSMIEYSSLGPERTFAPNIAITIGMSGVAVGIDVGVSKEIVGEGLIGVGGGVCNVAWSVNSA